uniref:Uncharacterized protein n=1 Tax=Rhizophora mucronata TaxID=61149 RepID=A0A2P2PP93_RHIMU
MVCGFKLKGLSLCGLATVAKRYL